MAFVKLRVLRGFNDENGEPAKVGSSVEVTAPLARELIAIGRAELATAETKVVAKKPCAPCEEKKAAKAASKRARLSDVKETGKQAIEQLPE